MDSKNFAAILLAFFALIFNSCATQEFSKTSLLDTQTIALENLDANFTNAELDSIFADFIPQKDANKTDENLEAKEKNLPPKISCPITLNSSSASLYGVINLLAKECALSIIFADDYAIKLAKNLSPNVNFDRLNLDAVLEILLDENDLIYNLDSVKKTLKITFLTTKTFDVNYIATTRIGSSNTDVIFSQEGNIGTNFTNSISAGYATTNQNQEKQTHEKILNLATNPNALTTGKSGSKIYSIDELNFWGELESEIYNIAYRPGDAYAPAEDSEILTNAASATNTANTPKNATRAIVLNKGAGLLSITGSSAQIKRVENYLDALSKKLQTQVLIDVHILNVAHINQSTMGVDFGELFKLGAVRVGGSVGPASTDATTATNAQNSQALVNFSNAGTSYGVSIFAPQISLDQIISFLRTYGEVQSVSNPKVLTLNNQPAMISVGQVLRYLQSTTYQSATNSSSFQNSTQSYPSVFSGILLDVTPSIKDDEILLKINPSITKAIDPSIETSPTALPSPPNLATKQLSALVKLKDGERVILGGLINKTTSDVTRFVPILGQIPLLKYLFSWQSRTNNTDEMLIIITPRIIR